MREHGGTQGLAERRWNDFHRQLHALASTRALAAYISRIQLAGTETEVWELIFSTKHRNDAPAAKRRLLLRQLAWDVAHGASGATMARALMAMVLWPELDALFDRFHRRFPECDLLAKYVIDALGIAVCELRQPLEGGANMDIERDILAATLFVAGKLVADSELRRARQVTRTEVSPTYEAPTDEDTDPDGPATVLLDPSESTVSLRLPEHPRLTPPPPPPPPPAGTFRPLPGFFRVAELSEVLDFEHEFRFSDAGYDEEGARLVAVSLRVPLRNASSTPRL